MKLNWNVDASWTLFIDRDGVINERIFDGYVLSKEDFVFKNGVLEVSQSLFSKFKHVILVTNQQCVGKGLIQMEHVDDIHDYMRSVLKQHKAHIDLVLVAAELKGSEPMQRKPSTAMGYMAQETFSDIDFSKSVMVGDTDSDIHFGKNLGMKTVLIRSEEKTSLEPDLHTDSLSELNQLL
jgi:histidinol-phosphate phosphatase family protein